MRRAVDVQLIAVSCILALTSACGVSEGTSEDPAPTASITQGLVIHDRALAITDQFTLRSFPLDKVLDRIIQTSGANGVTPTSLFNQWWDTQNQGPGLGMGPHCDDEMTGGQPSMNGYPWECPRGEGYQAFVDPFRDVRDPLYWPIGLFNRFDLAPGDGGHCGEYRIAYAMRPGHRDSRGSNFLIFEAVLPNPHPERGIEGCVPVAKFWYNLSFIDDPNIRRELLHQFYWSGIEDFKPVIHVDHYGTQLVDGGYGCSTGQIRTNQFVGGDWNLREFRMVKDCRCADDCNLVVAPTTVKSNPSGESFHGGSTEPRAGDLQSLVINSVWPLGHGGVNDIGWDVSNKLNTGESISRFGGPTDYFDFFSQGANTHPQFKADLSQEAINFFGGTLDSNDIVHRASTQSCAGCHHISNSQPLGNGDIWPNSIRFVHVDEFPINGSFPLSDAMHQEFLPARAALLEAFLNSGGTSNGSDARCELPIPEELHVDCRREEELGPKKPMRSFSAIGLEKLKPRLAPSIGGARVH